ncbi:MAG: hypothetical protein AUJ52_05890 [Elusimicrobia bacterium CG1_02_63_36]|nr:MAG: hypothetical protein AUJ52_05890 [Elusimicrobia bacterium CG1_02_63_36]PIP84934.1 MAG: hypothetical protein COR54_01535 [Elusimicrobia bacterium CG22_combo_CG10-13_8_21_14_all_63_91]PJA13295.1 MAG: hypothetical protein COX66_15155 [Elusimicrobia bacterium CG_4_10_14_0_2_um_filter_63_34]PJB26127.1 MAG: hypothetical protein CO113_05135 [Elusimicrobia bacterium CG_4_9_14_3_um_filter_62_55]
MAAFARVGVICVLLLGAAPARAGGVPQWVREVPREEGLVFFVGARSDAPSYEEGVEGAYRDAAGQAAKYIRSRWSQRTLEHDRGLETRLLEEIKGTASGILHRFEIRRTHYEERKLRGWGRRGRAFDVWVLVAMPEQEIRAERSRLDDAGKRMTAALSSLCARLSKNAGMRNPVAIGNFFRKDDHRPYPFSGILQTHFKTCLHERGVPVQQAGGRVVAEGEFWIGPDGASVNGRLSRTSDSRVLASETVRFPVEALEPEWIRDPLGPEDFFKDDDDRIRLPEPPASILIVSKPEGARVHLDGRDRGETPMTIHGLKPGGHSLTFDLEDFVPIKRDVSVDAGEQETVAVSLERKTGRLVVVTKPAGAAVFIDGENRGRTPARFDSLATGRYRVEFKLAKHKPQSQAVAIEYRREFRLERELAETDGALFLLVQPSGAEVVVDGVVRGQTASEGKLHLERVAAGSRKVVVRKKGFEERVWTVRVRPEEMQSIAGALTRALPKERKPAGPGVFERIASWRADRNNRSSNKNSFDFSIPRPKRPQVMALASLGSATIGSGYTNIRLLEGALYGWNSRIGFGTSLASIFMTDTLISRSRFERNNGANAPVQSKHKLTLGSVFPIQAYLVPFAHQYEAWGTPTVASVQLYLQASFWAQAELEGTQVGQDNKTGPTGSVIDYGVMVHLGPAVGMRFGVVKTSLKGFSSGADIYARGGEEKTYIAGDFSFGGFFSGGD